MINDVDELMNKAVDNKQGIKKEKLNIPIGGDEQNFRISGIGQKAIKIEKYVKYDEIMTALAEGKENGLEKILFDIVNEYEPEEEDVDEGVEYVE